MSCRRIIVKDLLILVKTYPNPSGKYRETTCVAALTRDGQMRRVFPVPFRFMDGSQQFRKWEWINAAITKARSDHRPESYNIDIDSIVRLNEHVGTDHGWARRKALLQSHIMSGYGALEARRSDAGQTLGVLRPSRIVSLDITKLKTTDWTPHEREKLERESLFDSEEVKQLRTLRKLPYDFHYVYEIQTPGGVEKLRHQITDWEIGQLYWRCVGSAGPNWEEPFRKKLVVEFSERDIHFVMGTVHRFPDQWLIVGLVYPPKLQPSVEQTSLDL